MLLLALFIGETLVARAEMIRYRQPLTAAEQRCLVQLLETSDWRFTPEFHRGMMAAAVARADLNGDGRKEYIYVIRQFASCGTVGCTLVIGAAGKDGVCHAIYDDAGSERAIVVLRQRDHGYRRLETPCEVRFDGKEYRKVREECPNAVIHR